MKKHIFILSVAVMLCSVGDLYAQSWKSLLSGAAKAVEKKVLGSDSITMEKMTGTWEYSKPALKLKSDNVLADMGAEAAAGSINDKLKEYFELVGIKQGSFSISFSADSIVSTKVLGKTVSGVYSIAEGGKSINIGFKEGGKSFKIDIEYAGSSITLLMGSEKLMSFVQTIVEKIPESSTINTIEALLKNYKELKVGFEMTKKN